MQIVHAEFDDITDIVELGEVMHAESPRFNRYPYLYEKMFQQMYNVVESGDGIALIARDEQGTLVGAMVGFVVEFFFSDARYATDYGLFIAPEARGSALAPRLVERFENEAVALGAEECAPGISTDVAVDRTVDLYKSLGYRPVGANMVKVL